MFPIPRTCCGTKVMVAAVAWGRLVESREGLPVGRDIRGDNTGQWPDTRGTDGNEDTYYGTGNNDEEKMNDMLSIETSISQLLSDFEECSIITTC